MPSFLGSRPNNYERCNPTKVRMNEDTWKGLWSSWPLISSIPLSLDKGTFSELPFCRTTFHEVYLWRPPEVHMSKSLVCRRNIFPGVKTVKRVGGMKSYNLESFIPAVQYVTDYTALWRLKCHKRGNCCVITFTRGKEGGLYCSVHVLLWTDLDAFFSISLDMTSL